MRQLGATALIVALLLVGACGQSNKPPALNPSMQTEKDATAENQKLLNAVEQHPSLQDPSQAAPPISVSTTIPPPAPDSGSMAGHDHMNDQAAESPQDSNQQDPSQPN